jgi:hypothetical protein
MFSLNFFNSEIFHYLNCHYQGGEAYCQSTEVDLQNSPATYNFTSHFPEKKEHFDHFFNQIASSSQFLGFFQESACQLDLKVIEDIEGKDFIDSLQRIGFSTLAAEDFIKQLKLVIFVNRITLEELAKELKKLNFFPSEVEIFIKRLQLIYFVKKIESVGFKVLNQDVRLGLVLEHSSLAPWVIKKNHSFSCDDQQKLRRIYKLIQAPNIPTHLLNSDNKSENWTTLNLEIYHDYRNPLRVEVAKRGQEWINRLGLDRIQVVKEYLYYLPGSSDQAPLHQKTVVLSQKVSVLSGKANIEQYAYLAVNNPSELEKIVQQICVFIKYTQLIDNHLDDICFLANSNNKVVFLDCEPGNLSDITQEKNEGMQSFDRGAIPIIGLRNLQFRLKKQLIDDNIPVYEAHATQKIFDHAIDAMVNEIIEERYPIYTKIYKNLVSPFTPFIVLISSAKKIIFNYQNNLNNSNDSSSQFTISCQI